jgi:predicted DNA-binding transcriptional regulator YafY
LNSVAVHERHDELLRLLRRKSDWTTEQLALELRVARRTILRDLGRLRDRGFHISGLTGPGGGVHLEPTSVMVTSQLKGDEVVALILTVAVARATPTIPFAGGAENALAKIEAALPRQRTAELQAFMQRVLVGDPSSGPTGEISSVDSCLVTTFEEAFTTNRLLGFDYTDARGRQTRRTVEPHGLLVRVPLWYVIGWDPKPDAARLFRADRIRQAEVTTRTFVPRPHELVTGICPDARPALHEPPRGAEPGGPGCSSNHQSHTKNR